jgi:catalase
MHGYGSNTFALVNEYGSFYYCKFHYKSDQGIGTMDPDKATKTAGEDPDYLTEDPTTP